MKQRKPLLLINHRSPISSSGKPSGISNYMLSLTRALLERGTLDIGLVTSWRKEDLPEDITQRLHSFSQRSLIRPRILDVLRQSIVMPRYARKIGADAILNVDPIGTPLGATARVTVVHDLYFKLVPSLFRWHERVFSDLILRMMIAGSKSIVCVSGQTKNDLDRFYPSATAKSLRIYGDAGVGRRTSRATNADAARSGHVLWVGKVTANKNIACLYQALRILADRGQSIPAVIVGNDVFGYAEAAETTYGGGLNARRLGNVSDDELQQLYDDALCFVNTSSYEGFGMPVIEAQRSGLPVICSTGGALAEVAGEGALMFSPNDPHALAEHLGLLQSSDALQRQLIDLGHKNAMRFSWSKTADQIERLVLDSQIAKSNAPDT